MQGIQTQEMARAGMIARPQMKALSCTVRYCGIYSIVYLDTQFVVNCSDTASIHCYRMHSHFLHAKYFTKLHFLLQKAILKVVLYTYYEYSSRNRKHFPCFHAVIHCRNTSGSLGKREIEVGMQASKASVSTLFQVLPNFHKTLRSFSKHDGNLNGNVLRNKRIVHTKQRERIISSPNRLGQFCLK